MQPVTLDSTWTAVVNPQRTMMRKEVQARIRRRIRDRLDELGMTARELARSVGHDDAWISGVLKGAHGIAWKDFDAIADKLDLSPSELVRYDDAEMRELTPTEMRLLRHYRDWPDGMRYRWLDILDHFSSAKPDRDVAALLDRLRGTPRSLRRPVLAWLLRLLEEGIPPDIVPGGGVVESGAELAAPDTTRRDQSAETQSSTRKRADGRRVKLRK